MEKWRYSSTILECGIFDAPAALPPEKDPSALIGD
jgi:hypothetical protein